ncbi:MAG: hypothetical protein IPG50_02185 [Myxococcales bacterium]|nr:hypothetical protein [Myxococcales bacterium]
MPHGVVPPKSPSAPPDPPLPVCLRGAASGTFVAKDGTDSETCGDAAAPCKTIQWATRDLAAQRIFVAGGTLGGETISLRADLVIEGGWERYPRPRANPGPPTWAKDCKGITNATTLVAADLVAEDIGGTAQLIDLTFRPTRRGPGESAIGLRAVGASTRVELTAVTISVAAAPEGSPGASGTTGEAGADDCPSADGAAATLAGPSGADATELGTFSRSGYEARAGTPGADGLAGNAAPPGGDGQCVACVNQCAGTTTCSISSSLRYCGTQAKSGCGGHGGRGGAGGAGGGSTVALLAWDATIVLSGGALKAGDGGAGALGGPGGSGGPGGTGLAGTAAPPVACATQCESVQGACAATQFATGQGGVGTVGGTGSAGGNGGRGAGGSSYAIVQNAGASVEYGPSTLLVHGVGGAGSVPGNAADVFVPP